MVQDIVQTGVRFLKLTAEKEEYKAIEEGDPSSNRDGQRASNACTVSL